ncbi:UTRA domain-containing protein [Saccharopolyspora cebuensis]|uniref:UTRA domain-containing protein n=1 Tax=Saccharopolyspora cebuensis TaxID=418759 RepID=A0ABV4CIT3_9PSEU
MKNRQAGALCLQTVVSRSTRCSAGRFSQSSRRLTAPSAPALGRPAPWYVTLSHLGTSEAWKIERVRYLDGTPVIYMRTLVPHARFPHFTAELLEGASLLGLMREHGCTPSGGPRQVQAVPADQDLARALDVGIGDPLLLLEGVTRDELGDGLESFSVWHRAGTVFDVDAHVTSEPAAAASQDELRRLRLLAHELHSTLARLDANAP